MSSGHSTTTATVHTPHGPVTAACVVAWVRCDTCGEIYGAVGPEECDGPALCDCIADGWTQDDEGRDVCPTCRGER